MSIRDEQMRFLNEVKSIIKRSQRKLPHALEVSVDYFNKFFSKRTLSVNTIYEQINYYCDDFINRQVDLSEVSFILAGYIENQTNALKDFSYNIKPWSHKKTIDQLKKAAENHRKKLCLEIDIQESKNDMPIHDLSINMESTIEPGRIFKPITTITITYPETTVTLNKEAFDKIIRDKLSICIGETIRLGNFNTKISTNTIKKLNIFFNSGENITTNQPKLSIKALGV